MKTKWPKLSDTCTYVRFPGVCQHCGCRSNDAKPVSYWIECDDNDQPTRIMVCLCEPCAAKIIEPHPRLYSKIGANHPLPGAMSHLCGACLHRVSLTCTHPSLKSNGGEGLAIISNVSPARCFWDGVDKQGRRTGGSHVYYPAPPVFCWGNPTPETLAAVSPEFRKQYADIITKAERDIAQLHPTL